MNEGVFSNFECMCKIFYGLSENHETVCFVKNMLINHLVKSVCLEMYTRKGNTKNKHLAPTSQTIVWKWK